MLVLSRKKLESIVIDGRITVTVVVCEGNRVRLGIMAPDNVNIVRQELLMDPSKELASDGHQPQLMSGHSRALRLGKLRCR